MAPAPTAAYRPKGHTVYSYPYSQKNTALWLRDLRAQMERDGVWEGV